MPLVERIDPRPGQVDASHLVNELRTAQRRNIVFDPTVVSFVADLSRAIRSISGVRERPALAALAHWIRPASIEQLRNEWNRDMHDPRIVRVPRGAVFHLPPTNVDTLFVYTWILSALMGNANIIRISPNALETTVDLRRVISSVLGEHPNVAAQTAFVSYGHDADVTRALSESDLRVVWGGDATVSTVRLIDRPAHARELCFPDRYSYALLSTAAVLAASNEEMRILASNLYNDAYWFDQLGCASPRLLIWNGAAVQAEKASDKLFHCLVDELSRRGYELPASGVMAKVAHVATLAAEQILLSAQWSNRASMHGTVRNVSDSVRSSPGGGLFYEWRVDELSQLTELVQPKDQTLSYFGFDARQMRELVQRVGSRGLDRVVPVGQALSFGRFWDGHDLMAEFSRVVVVGT